MVSSMISSVRGTLEGAGGDWVDVAIGGVTLRVSVPASEVETLGSVGSDVHLFTTLQVREDSLNLYGFTSLDARQTFDTLIGISGIGPRVALSILSIFSPEALAATVESGDVKGFTAVPGVGPKTASRMILELKGKLELDWNATSGQTPDADAVDALTALGYSQMEARDALSALPKDGERATEDKVRLALLHLAGGA